MVGRGFMVAAVLLANIGGARAQTSSPIGGAAFQTLPAGAPSVMTPLGAGLVTGKVGMTETVMVPGPGAPGTVVNNGNGTGTLTIPGQAPVPVFTSR